MASSPEPSGEKQSSPNRRDWQTAVRPHWIEIILAVCLVAVGAAQVYIYVRQAGIMDKQADISVRQLETSIATERPWVKVRVVVGPKGLYYDANGGAELDLIFLLKNTGHTPADTVRIEGEPRINVATNDVMTELEKRCAQVKSQQREPTMWGYTIFPGDEIQQQWTMPLANHTELMQAKNGFIHPFVLGCVDYFFTFGDQVHHQSRFIYSLSIPHQGGGTIAINIKDGHLGPERLQMPEWPAAGSFRAD